MHGKACFTRPRTVRVGGRVLSTPRFVVATASRPTVPVVSELASVPYLTNETLFDLKKLPRHSIRLGAGVMGIEMAQAFPRLGSEVTVLERGTPLSQHDADAVAVVLEQLASKGAVLRAGAAIALVGMVKGGFQVVLADGGTVLGSHLLIAVERRAVLDGLGLEAAGIPASPRGINVDRRRRISNPYTLATGDCRVGP